MVALGAKHQTLLQRLGQVEAGITAAVSLHESREAVSIEQAQKVGFRLCLYFFHTGPNRACLLCTRGAFTTDQRKADSECPGLTKAAVLATSRVFPAVALARFAHAQREVERQQEEEARVRIRLAEAEEERRRAVSERRRAGVKCGFSHRRV